METFRVRDGLAGAGSPAWVRGLEGARFLFGAVAAWAVLVYHAAAWLARVAFSITAWLITLNLIVVGAFAAYAAMYPLSEWDVRAVRATPAGLLLLHRLWRRRLVPWGDVRYASCTSYDLLRTTAVDVVTRQGDFITLEVEAAGVLLERIRTYAPKACEAEFPADLPPPPDVVALAEAEGWMVDGRLVEPEADLAGLHEPPKPPATPPWRALGTQTYRDNSSNREALSAVLWVGGAGLAFLAAGLIIDAVDRNNDEALMLEAMSGLMLLLALPILVVVSASKYRNRRITVDSSGVSLGRRWGRPYAFYAWPDVVGLRVAGSGVEYVVTRIGDFALPRTGVRGRGELVGLIEAAIAYNSRSGR
jgi:hypothetical protein